METALDIPTAFNPNRARELIATNNIEGLLDFMNSTGAFLSVLRSFSDLEVKEMLLSISFATLMVSAGSSDFRYATEQDVPAETASSTPGQRPRLDHIIHFTPQKISHILEFKIDRSRRGTWQRQIGEAIVQCLKYKTAVRTGFTGLFTIVVFANSDEQPTSIARMTRPLTLDELESLAHSFKQSAADPYSRLKEPGIVLDKRPKKSPTQKRRRQK